MATSYFFENLIFWVWDWSDLFRAQDCRWYIEAVHCPYHKALQSVVQTSPKGIQNIIVGNGLAAGVVVNLLVLRINRIELHTEIFCLDLIPWTFSCLNIAAKQQKCKIRGLHLLIEHLELTNSIYPKQVGSLCGDSGTSSRHLRVGETEKLTDSQTQTHTHTTPTYVDTHIHTYFNAFLFRPTV